MTQTEIKKFVPGSGRAVYRAVYTLNWGSRKKPGSEFEYEYPVKCNPDAYEIVKILIGPERKAPGSAEVETVKPKRKAVRRKPAATKALAAELEAPQAETPEPSDEG